MHLLTRVSLYLGESSEGYILLVTIKQNAKKINKNKSKYTTLFNNIFIIICIMINKLLFKIYYLVRGLRYFCFIPLV